MSDGTLYARLGGEDKIRAVAVDIVGNHLENAVIKSRFANGDRHKLAALAAEFICMGTGGPQKYTGKDMLAAHRGMNISEQEYLAVTDDIMAALDKHGVGAREKQEVLAIVYGLKGDIIRV
jgi:hemoglobin